MATSEADVKIAFREAYNLLIREKPEQTPEYFMGLIERMQAIMDQYPKVILLPFLMGTIYDYLDHVSKKEAKQ